jgi:hypothetical protein
MYKPNLAVCCEILTKHLKQSEHNIELLMLNLVVRKETVSFTRLTNTDTIVTFSHSFCLKMDMFDFFS